MVVYPRRAVGSSTSTTSSSDRKSLVVPASVGIISARLVVPASVGIISACLVIPASVGVILVLVKDVDLTVGLRESEE